ncbi:MAG: polyhydroxyalkanoate synthesis regulator DNA-binding domain-containing protein [Myxococcota bacterium]
MAWKRPARPVVVKKYSNRRLYDTHNSRYVTLVELAALIESGHDVRVVDAKSGQDLTQGTLMQIILDGRGAAELLPVELLTQLIRMGDDALAEFLGRYMSYALELYVQAKQGAQAIAPYNPFAAVPFAAASSIARFWGGGEAGKPEPNPQELVSDAADANENSEIDTLRLEIEELKKALEASNSADDAPSPKPRRKKKS